MLLMFGINIYVYLDRILFNLGLEYFYLRKFPIFALFTENKIKLYL